MKKGREKQQEEEEKKRNSGPWVVPLYQPKTIDFKERGKLSGKVRGAGKIPGTRHIANTVGGGSP